MYECLGTCKAGAWGVGLWEKGRDWASGGKKADVGPINWASHGLGLVRWKRDCGNNKDGLEKSWNWALGLKEMGPIKKVKDTTSDYKN